VTSDPDFKVTTFFDIEYLRNDTRYSYSCMLHDLGWRDLKDPRRDLRLALLYKIVTGHVAINTDQIGLVAADNSTRANHRYKFRAIGASSTGLRYSFAVRTVSDWNQLLAVVVEQKNQSSAGQVCACSHAMTHHHHH